MKFLQLITPDKSTEPPKSSKKCRERLPTSVADGPSVAVPLPELERPVLTSSSWRGPAHLFLLNRCRLRVELLAKSTGVDKVWSDVPVPSLDVSVGYMEVLVSSHPPGAPVCLWTGWSDPHINCDPKSWPVLQAMHPIQATSVQSSSDLPQRSQTSGGCVHNLLKPQSAPDLKIIQESHREPPSQSYVSCHSPSKESKFVIDS